MAIEISPKGEKTKTTLFINILFWGGIALLILVVGGYLFLQNEIKKSSNDLKSFQETILQKRTPDIENLERIIFSWRQKIEDYNLLFTQHKAPSNLFTFLENKTHPKVWWVDFNFDFSATNNVKLKGTAQDFPTLQQQLMIFANESYIRNVTLNRVSLVKGGSVEFDLEISINPEIFKPQPSSGI